MLLHRKIVPNNSIQVVDLLWSLDYMRYQDNGVKDTCIYCFFCVYIYIYNYVYDMYIFISNIYIYMQGTRILGITFCSDADDTLRRHIPDGTHMP